MTTDTAPAKPSVSFTITPGEFQLLATFMAPMQFNEATGASIWVTSHGGWREWLVTANGITTVVFSREDELGRYGIETDESWAFPIPEHVLVTMGKFSMSLSDPSLSDASSGAMNVTLSDDWVTLTSATYSMSVSQNPNAKCPPMIPHVESLLVANVDPTALWTMLSSARVWPTGGVANGMNTPMRASCDFTRRQLVLQADWTVVDAGIHEYRMPAEFDELLEGVELKPFNIPHSSILKLLRDPMAAEKFGPVKMHIAPEGVGHMKLSGENWAMYVPTIPNIKQWGHDLDEVLGDIPYVWEDCSRVSLMFPDLDQGIIELSALPDEPRYALYKYRASYEIHNDVIASTDLYREINAINEGTAGCRLVVDGNRLLAVTDLTQENYQHLSSYINSFSNCVSGLSPLLSVISSAI